MARDAKKMGPAKAAKSAPKSFKAIVTHSEELPLEKALLLSMHVVARDFEQFASQMMGRLLHLGEKSRIREFLETLKLGAPRPWLRPLTTALTPPGTDLIWTSQDGGRRVRLSAEAKVVAAPSPHDGTTAQHARRRVARARVDRGRGSDARARRAVARSKHQLGSRRLGFATALPEELEAAVREGRVPQHGAMRSLLPLARATVFDPAICKYPLGLEGLTRIRAI